MDSYFLSLFIKIGLVWECIFGYNGIVLTNNSDIDTNRRENTCSRGHEMNKMQSYSELGSGQSVFPSLRIPINRINMRDDGNNSGLHIGRSIHPKQIPVPD